MSRISNFFLANYLFDFMRFEVDVRFSFSLIIIITVYHMVDSFNILKLYSVG
jgi:hypothetical protein